MPTRPIGIFDSGEGGLTVARELAALLPGEDLLYACDTAHFPYGPRPLEQVAGFYARFMDFYTASRCKLVVIACNTATAATLLAENSPVAPLPGIGVVEPGARAAALATRNGRIAVAATEATVRAGVYPLAIRRVAPDLQVEQRACPVLVTMAEMGELDSPEVRAEVAACVVPLLASGADTLVLGCTHLPHMQNIIAEVAGPGIRLVDPAVATAAEVRNWLAERGLLNPRAGGAAYRFFCTGDPGRFTRVATQLWPTVQDARHLPLWQTSPAGD